MDDDQEQGWSLSFAACGFLGIYYVGVTHCLQDRAPHLLRDVRMLFGASAGALQCVSMLCEVPLERILELVTDTYQIVRTRNLCILYPPYSISRYLRESLHRELPDNAHQLMSGKLCISLTRVSDGKNVLVSDFQSKDEVIDALVCSCFIPFYCGLIPPSFRGVRYMDGGMSDGIPFFDAKTTITVSPFYGENDICPKVKATSFLSMDFYKLSLLLCPENIYLLTRVMLPPDNKALVETCIRGYLDALRFLEEKGICEAPWPDLEIPPHEPGSLKETLPEPDKLLDHLHSISHPWDESILEKLSPKLALALRKAVKKQSSCMKRICRFLPMKVLSYALLPCTQPVESAIAVVQRLAMWRPNIPSDGQWLQWTTSKLCSPAVMRLLPVPRSSMPASCPKPSP